MAQVDRRSSAARQPAASHNTTTTTSDTTWPTGNRKSILNRPPRPCKKPNPTNPATCQLLATIQRPNEPAEAFPSQRKRFSSHKTFQNVFKRFFKPKPTFRWDTGLLSIATGATRRTKSKMSVFCQKKPPYLRQRSQQRRKSSS